MNAVDFTILTHEEMTEVYGGSPKEWLHKLGDWVAYGLGWAIGMEGAKVAGSTMNGGNAAAVLPFK